MIKNNVRRDCELDTIKGVCIVFVIITHAQWSAEERLRYFFPYWIDMAVPIFMIISGYVNSVSFQRRNVKSLDDAYSLKYVLMRFIRYTIPAGLTLLVELGFKLMYKESVDIFTFCITGGEGPGSYYYPIMIQFIFVFPIIFFIVQKYDTVGFILCGILNGIYEMIQTVYGMNAECYRLLIFRYIFVISFGCYLVKKREMIKTRYEILLLLIGIAYIYAVSYLNYVPHTISKWINTSWIACMYIMPIFSLVLKKLRRGCRLLEKIGEASFNIFFVQKVYYCRVVGVTYLITSVRIFQVVLHIFICVTIGVVFYYFEKPITDRIIKYVGSKMKRLAK